MSLGGTLDGIMSLQNKNNQKINKKNISRRWPRKMASEWRSKPSGKYLKTFTDILVKFYIILFQNVLTLHLSYTFCKNVKNGKLRESKFPTHLASVCYIKGKTVTVL